jgi:hypothetical protein
MNATSAVRCTTGFVPNGTPDTWPDAVAGIIVTAFMHHIGCKVTADIARANQIGRPIATALTPHIPDMQQLHLDRPQPPNRHTNNPTPY